MSENLAVIVLGHRHAGKSETWNVIFKDTNVRSEQAVERILTFSTGEQVKVYLRNGSYPVKKVRLADEAIPLEPSTPHILLCSIPYVQDARNSINWLEKNDYFVYAHWLNPGYHDNGTNDYLGLVPFLLEKNAMLGIRNGKEAANARVKEMMDFIYGWAKCRNLMLDAICQQSD